MRRWSSESFDVHFPPVMTLLLRRTSLLLLAISLAACGQKPVSLEPREVLRRAIIRSSSIESASISASASVLLKGYATFSGSAVIQGVIRGAGGYSADISFQGKDSVGGGQAESGLVRVVSIDGSQVFLKPESLRGPQLEPFAQSLSGSLNGWWFIGQPSSLPPGGRHTLSPAELDEMSSLFTIGDVKEPEIFSGRRKAYRIPVSLEQKAVAALFAHSAKENTAVRGTLWIDTADFTLVRATWRLGDLLTPFGPADILLDVSFTDINRAPEIVLPTGSASALPLNGVFATISH